MSSYPPPPPPPPGMPGSYPGAMSAPQNGAGTTALVTGILSFLCCPVILSIVAIVYGRKGQGLAAQGLATNGGAAKAGYILGIVSLALFVVGIIIEIVLIASGHGNFSFSASTT